MDQHRNVLVTCGGKWVGMVLQLRRAMERISALKGGRVLVASMDEITPAGCFADRAVVVPPISHPDYVHRLLEVCSEQKVRIVVPLIDLDLNRLARHAAEFREIGTSLICPEPELVDLCLDKVLFEGFARDSGLSCPRSYSTDELAGAPYPLFRKPRRGFGSMGSGMCSSKQDASRDVDGGEEFVFQEFISEREVSVDAYIARNGMCTLAVQRMRDKVVAGEAYQSHTIKSPTLRDLAIRSTSALSDRGLRGPLNIQMFSGDEPKLIEVNTRLGSASVLSNMASGGRLFESVLNEACGGTSEGDPDDYTEGMRLYRFLGDVFVDGSEDRAVVPSLEAAA